MGSSGSSFTFTRRTMNFSLLVFLFATAGATGLQMDSSQVSPQNEDEHFDDQNIRPQRIDVGSSFDLQKAFKSRFTSSSRFPKKVIPSVDPQQHFQQISEEMPVKEVLQQEET